MSKHFQQRKQKLMRNSNHSNDKFTNMLTKFWFWFCINSTGIGVNFQFSKQIQLTMGSTPTTAPANIRVQQMQVETIASIRAPVQTTKQIVIQEALVENVTKKEEDISTQRGTIELDQRRPSEARSMKAKIKDVKKIRESEQITINPEASIRKVTQKTRFEDVQIVDLE